MYENLNPENQVRNSEDVKENRFEARPFHPMIGQEVVVLVEKVFLPVKEFPQHNFVGKLLGPKGSTLKQLQAATRVKMSILGRGSTRDKNVEELSNDPQYEHLKEPLHVLISVKAKKIEAHRRMAAALREINKFMDPGNEEIQHEQTQVMSEHNLHNVREAALPPSPIVRFGIPPHGAIILNEQVQMGQGRSPVQDSYNYTSYPGNNDRSSFRPGEKRTGFSNNYLPKKQRFLQ